MFTTLTLSSYSKHISLISPSFTLTNIPYITSLAIPCQFVFSASYSSSNTSAIPSPSLNLTTCPLPSNSLPFAKSASDPTPSQSIVMSATIYPLFSSDIMNSFISSSLLIFTHCISNATLPIPVTLMSSALIKFSTLRNTLITANAMLNITNTTLLRFGTLSSSVLFLQTFSFPFYAKTYSIILYLQSKISLYLFLYLQL